MKRYVVTHNDCPWCPSSDAYSEFYEDGEFIKYCFSCGRRVAVNENEVSDEDHSKPTNPNGTSNERPLKKTVKIEQTYRDLTPETLSHWGVKKLTDKNTIVYPYHRYGESRMCSQKERFKGVDGKKRFAWNQMDNDVGLFGCHLFAPNGNRITVTEGENDAMAAWQMSGDFPVVSLKNGAKTSKGISDGDFEYLNSFNEIIVCFDNDKPGRAAIDDFCSKFHGKCRVMELPPGYKDAHDMLVGGKNKEYRNAFFNAKPWQPRNVVYPIDILDEIISPPQYDIIPYPWPHLNDQIYGLHSPEVITILAQPKVGKSLITAFIEDHVLKSTDDKIADITVENTPEERSRTLLSVKMGKPLHLKLAGEDINVTDDEIKRHGEEYFGDRRLILFERNGLTRPQTIIDKVRYFVTVLGCKYVVFDHINYLSSNHDSDERKSIDEVSTKLIDMAKELRFNLIVVSHVNDEGKAFGSRNLIRASYTVLSLERDKDNPVEALRNLTKLTVTESRRYGSRIGPPVYLRYDEQTFKLTSIDPDTIESLTERNEGIDDV
jgi:twinkle protein